MNSDTHVVLYREEPWSRAADLAGFDYAAGKPARLIAHLEPSHVLGCWSAPVDLDGDGLPEFVSVQNAAPYDHPAMHKWGYDPAWAEVWCVTAMDREGRTLWQHGTPWRGREAFPNHGGAGILVCDADGDGKPEIVTAHRQTLFIFGADGAIRRARRFPDGMVAAIKPFPPSGPSRALLVALMPMSAFEPLSFVYLDAATLENAAEPYATPKDFGAAMSAPLPGGGEGWLMNAWLYDGQGRAVARLPEELFPDRPGVHADYIDRGDLNGDGCDELVFCVEHESHCEVLAVDLSFNLLFRRVMGHAQTACIVPPSSEGPGVVMVTDRGGCRLTGLNAGGTTLWEKGILAYPGPRIRRGDDTLVCMSPHRSRQIVPAVMDRWGSVRERFQEMLDYPRTPIYSRYERLATYRSHDLGRYFHAYACDWNGDGTNELILNDRQGVWVYAPPDSSPPPHLSH